MKNGRSKIETTRLRACSLIGTVIFLFFTAGLVAQDFGEEKKEPITTKPGFGKDALMFSITGGLTASAGGSYIRHEKKYEDTQRFLLASGLMDPPVLSFLARPYHFEQSNNPTGQFSIEYGYGDHLGLGVTVLYFSIGAERQEIIPVLMVSSETGLPEQIYMLEPLLTEKTLYQGTSVLFQMVFHPFPGRLLDPFAAFRLGPGGFSGNAHRDLRYDPWRYDTRLENGNSRVIGVALGLNFYLGKSMGIIAEAAAYRQLLQSNVFSFRGLTTSHIQFGFFLNTKSF